MKPTYKFDKHWVKNELVMACDEGEQRPPFASTLSWAEVKDAVEGGDAASRGLKSVIDTMEGINSAILEYKEAHCSSQSSVADATAPRIGACVDRMNTCDEWSRSGQCTDVHLADFMEATCCASCRKSTTSTSTTTTTPIHLPDSSGDCIDAHELCSDWMAKGECDKNPKFMKSQCRKSCGACEDQNGGRNTKALTSSSASASASASSQSLISRRDATTKDTSTTGGGGDGKHSNDVVESAYVYDSEAETQHASHQDDAGKQYQMQSMGHFGVGAVEGTAEDRKHEEEDELQSNLRKRKEEIAKKHATSLVYSNSLHLTGQRASGAVGAYPAPPTQFEEAKDFVDSVVADAISVFDDAYESLPPSPFHSFFSSSSSKRVVTRNMHVGHLHDLHFVGIFAMAAMIVVLVGISFVIFGRRKRKPRRVKYGNNVDPYDVLRLRNSPKPRSKV